MRIPSLDIRTGVVPISAPGGVLTPPSDPALVGWWRDGVRPGEDQGRALLTGHAVHGGGGVFDTLNQLSGGDVVVVRTRQSVLRYRVTTQGIYTKAQLAERAQELFDQTGSPRLVLVSCLEWDGDEYLKNVVVVARPSNV
ncbi:MAG: sortase [Propionibacteriales bacterium]|nr:sortase [Propionibacteriales bacterium]